MLDIKNPEKGSLENLLHKYRNEEFDGYLKISGPIDENDIKSINESGPRKLDLSDAEIGIIKHNFFSKLKTLEEICLPTQIKEIEPHSFVRCEKLTAIHIADDNPYFFSENGCLCAKQEKKLLMVPCGLSGTYQTPDKTERIGRCAFDNCSKITEVILGENIKDIEEPTFYGCTISKIESKATTPPKCQRSYNDIELVPCRALVVPKQCAKKYKKTDYWSNFLIVKEEGEPIIDLF